MMMWASQVPSIQSLAYLYYMLIYRHTQPITFKQRLINRSHNVGYCITTTYFIDCLIFQVAKCHIKLELKNDDYTQLKGEIVGPPETPYDGGVFQLDIVIPETYPFNPPKVCIPRFLELGMAKCVECGRCRDLAVLFLQSTL